MKKKVTEWESQIDGEVYTFSHEKRRGVHVLTINGIPTEVKIGFMGSLFGIDEAIEFDGREARFVIEGNSRPDVVIDGKYLQSGKTYVKRPAWALAFAIACIAIPFVTLGGAIPFVVGFGSAAACVKVSKSAMPTAARVAVCTIITMLAWIFVFLLVIGVSALL